MTANGDVELCVYTHIAIDNIKEKPFADALNSRLFKYIRYCQPHNPNHLRPYIIIDNPHIMRQVIKEINPRFTHPGAEEIYNGKSDHMDAYAARWGKFADRIWEEEYLNPRIVHQPAETPLGQVEYCALPLDK